MLSKFSQTLYLYLIVQTTLSSRDSLNTNMIRLQEGCIQSMKLNS